MATKKQKEKSERDQTIKNLKSAGHKAPDAKQLENMQKRGFKLPMGGKVILAPEEE